MSLPLLIDFLREARVVALGVAAGISPYGQSPPQPGQGPPVLPPILVAAPEPGRSAAAAPAPAGQLAAPDSEETRAAVLPPRNGAGAPLRRQALAKAGRLQDRQKQVR